MLFQTKIYNCCKKMRKQIFYQKPLFFILPPMDRCLAQLSISQHPMSPCLAQLSISQHPIMPPCLAQLSISQRQLFPFTLRHNNNCHHLPPPPRPRRHLRHLLAQEAPSKAPCPRGFIRGTHILIMKLFIHLPTHSFTHSLTHSLTNSLIHSLIHSVTRPLITYCHC